MGKTKAKEVQQMLLYKIGDLQELQVCVDRLSSCQKSLAILTEGLRHAHEQHREQVRLELGLLKDRQDEVQKMLRALKEILDRSPIEEQVEFIDEETRFTTTDLGQEG